MRGHAHHRRIFRFFPQLSVKTKNISGNTGEMLFPGGTERFGHGGFDVRRFAFFHHLHHTVQQASVLLQTQPVIVPAGPVSPGLHIWVSVPFGFFSEFDNGLKQRVVPHQPLHSGPFVIQLIQYLIEAAVLLPDKILFINPDIIEENLTPGFAAGNIYRRTNSDTW